MNNLYEFIANGTVQNMLELENYAQQIKINKKLLVTGLYSREIYNGDDFNWAGKTIELYSTRQVLQDIYLCIRTDFLNEEVVISRLINPENSVCFNPLDRFIFKDTRFLVLKSAVPFSGYAKITLQTQKESDTANRILSIPVSRILLTSPLEQLSLQTLQFGLLTGTFAADCDIYPIQTSADKVADYFNQVSKELTDES